MTPQLAAALKRSIFPAILAALASAGTALGQVQLGASPNSVYVTIGLGAFVTGAIVLIRGIGEGLNDAQRAAIGKVLDSDVTPVALADVTTLLVPYAQRALKAAGIKATTAQINETALAAEHQILAAITSAVAANTPNAPDPNAVHPAAVTANAVTNPSQIQVTGTAAPDPALLAKLGADFVHGAVAPPEHTPDAMLPKPAATPSTVNDPTNSA